jgi:hypothetical protein
MAAGLGFKTFTTGEVLTAADVNGYLMQGVLVFASAAARNAAITSPQEGQFAFTKDTNGLWYYDGAAWVASGATGDIEGVTAGVGITGGGTSGTVTITNDMATTITAAGDIVVGTGSGTYDNLPIGTTNQILTADTTVSPYKVKWATPAAAASGLTKISSNAFSGVASVTIDGCFTSTYTDYLVIINNISATTSTDDLLMQLRYGSTTETAAVYYGSSFNVPFSGATSTIQTNAGTSYKIANGIGSATYAGSGQMFFSRIGNSNQPSAWRGQFLDESTTDVVHFGGKANDTRTYTGLVVKSSSSNISGNITIYGLAN